MAGLPKGASWVLSVPRTSISGQSCRTSYDLTLEVPEHHFQCILLAKQITKVSSDSERGAGLNVSIGSVTKNLWLSLNNCKFEKNSRNINHYGQN